MELVYTDVCNITSFGYSQSNTIFPQISFSKLFMQIYLHANSKRQHLFETAL